MQEDRYFSTDPATWQGCEGIVYVPKAGEMLYRVRKDELS